MSFFLSKYLWLWSIKTTFTEISVINMNWGEFDPAFLPNTVLYNNHNVLSCINYSKRCSQCDSTKSLMWKNRRLVPRADWTLEKFVSRFGCCSIPLIYRLIRDVVQSEFNVFPSGFFVWPKPSRGTNRPVRCWRRRPEQRQRPDSLLRNNWLSFRLRNWRRRPAQRGV